MATLATTDLCDAHESALASGALRILPSAVVNPVRLGMRPSFHGQVQTLRVFEDNALVRAELAKPGLGRVLVIDGGGSLRFALVGGNLAGLAQHNGWSGIVVYGAVRDADEIDAADIGLCAMGLSPRKSRKAGVGEVGVGIEFAGVSVEPGQWCYADRDGVLVADRALHA